MLSCLPLFCLPEKANDDPSTIKKPHVSDFEKTTPSSSAPKNNGWISFSQTVSEPQSFETPPTSPQLVPPLQSFDEKEGEGLLDAPLDEELPGDIFTLVDPFDTDEADGLNDFEQSTRSQQINNAFMKATKSHRKSVEEDDRDYSDSDENAVAEEKIHINYVPDVRTLKSRSGSVSFVTPHTVTKSDKLMASPLPPPPPILFPGYVERGGWMIKLSHQKGMSSAECIFFPC